MKNFEVSEVWSAFQTSHQEILELLRLAARQVRETGDIFQHRPLAFENIFLNLNFSLSQFSEHFEHDSSSINTIWALEEALQELYEAHSLLKDFSSGAHAAVWEFLEDMEGQLAVSMDLFDTLFVMTRIPMAFVNMEALLQAPDKDLPPKREEASALLQKELNALGSFKPAKKMERQTEVPTLKGKTRRKFAGRQLTLLKELKEMQQKGFWDKNLFQFCLEEACLSGKLEISQFLDLLYFFIKFGHLKPQRSVAFRLCFFYLMQFHHETSYRAYDKRSRYKILRKICHVKPEELEDLELSLADLRMVLLWIAEATGGEVKGNDFDPENFLSFLKSTEPVGPPLSNPGRIVLFFKLNLMNAPLYESLRFKNWKKATLQVFTGTSFKSITFTLAEIEGMSYWPKDEEVQQLIDSFSTK